MDRLSGKVALVTGAARGIGEAIARMFVDEGASVWLADIDASGGTRAADALGAHARFVPLDVREESEWKAAMLEIAHRDGAPDIVVNNAGVTGFEDGPPRTIPNMRLWKTGVACTR